MENIIDYISSQVMHKRLLPKVNSFLYNVFYLGFYIHHIDSIENNLFFSFNKPAILSFYNKDHGYRDGGNPSIWAYDILEKYNLKNDINKLYLICMPRILGYVFNPVSFWLCYNKENQIIAILYEVNNTFSETHTYICYHPDKSPIKNNDIITAKKCFHVSPFMNREGEYKFRFQSNKKKLGIWIDYYDKKNQKKLLTSVVGDRLKFSPRRVALGVLLLPFKMFKVIFLIHYQAVKLYLMGIAYVSKPLQEKYKVSKND